MIIVRSVFITSICLVNRKLFKVNCWWLIKADLTIHRFIGFFVITRSLFSWIYMITITLFKSLDGSVTLPERVESSAQVLFSSQWTNQLLIAMSIYIALGTKNIYTYYYNIMCTCAHKHIYMYICTSNDSMRMTSFYMIWWKYDVKSGTVLHYTDEKMMWFLWC